MAASTRKLLFSTVGVCSVLGVALGSSASVVSEASSLVYPGTSANFGSGISSCPFSVLTGLSVSWIVLLGVSTAAGTAVGSVIVDVTTVVTPGSATVVVTESGAPVTVTFGRVDVTSGRETVVPGKVTVSTTPAFVVGAGVTVTAGSVTIVVLVVPGFVTFPPPGAVTVVGGCVTVLAGSVVTTVVAGAVVTAVVVGTGQFTMAPIT